MVAYARWQAQIQIADDDGTLQVAPLAQIDVYDETNGARAALKSDRTGTVLGNPFNADSLGYAAFHTVGGRYRIVATLNGNTREWRNVPIGTAQEADLDDLTGNIIVNAGRWEIGNWDSDRPASGEELVSWIMTTTVVFPVAFDGSQAKARVASTGTAVYSVRKNDVQVGTVTFTASVTGVLALASETTFVAGDRLSIVAPDPRDATLSGVVMTLVGTSEILAP